MHSVSSFRGKLFASVIATLIVLGGRIAHAEVVTDQSRATARALADEAANAFARHDYATANELLQRAYALVPAPTIAVLEARALLKLNRFVEAAEAYHRARSTPLTPDTPEPFRRAVYEADAELERLLPRMPKLKILVRGAPLDEPALRVFMDDRVLPRAMLGVWIPVDPRTHALRAELNGTLGETQTLSLREGTSSVATVDVPEPGSGDTRRWGFVSLGVGAAGIGFGIATGVIAVNAYDDAESKCVNTCRAGSEGAAALERFETYRAVSTVSYAIGAVAVGLGGFLLLRASDRSGRSVTVAPTLRGLRIEGRL